MEKKGNLGKLGQVWASLDKLKATNHQQIRKQRKKAERIRKENKNLSGDGGGEESRVYNSPKAFGELKSVPLPVLGFRVYLTHITSQTSET